MGCDIHCYIEHKKPDSESWRDFGGRINPGRNYWMFGALAGVRVDWPPATPPRGIPDPMGYAATDDYWIYITDAGGDWNCTAESAARWVAQGSSVYKLTPDGRKTFVSSPDWHTHSWLTPAEFELAIAYYLKRSGFQINTLRLEDRAPESSLASQLSTSTDGDVSALNGLSEYWAILAALRCFEAQGLDARLVFWFDN